MADNATTPPVEQYPEGRRLSLLKGVKVLDLTRFLAGPSASLVLADLGADVLKVEQFVGDSTRTIPPYFIGQDSAYFVSTNRNKRSIVLDIRTPRGLEVLSRLIKESDVVLDNLRAPQRERLGLSWEKLKEINPRIVSCSVTGFGSDGPYADRPAYAIIVEALSGAMSLTGPEGGPSVRLGPPIGDLAAGLYTVIGVLAGLAERERTGEGGHIDVGMFDSQLSLLSYLGQYYLTGGFVASHQGRSHVSSPLYDTFETADGTELVIASNTQEQWVNLAGVLGIAELVDDPRFTNKQTRLVNRKELRAAVAERIAQWDVAKLSEALMAVEVPVAPINRVDKALTDPQALHREMVVRTRHRSGTDFLTVGTPIKTDTAGEPFLSPPGLGQHTVETMHELGYSQEEINWLAAENVISLGDAVPGV